MATSEQPKRRERLDTAARREQLIAVGRNLFQKRPYDQVSMDDVASEAGVSKGLIFHYFDSKRDLYVEIIGRGATDMMQASVVPDFATMTPMDQLTSGLHRYLEYAERAGAGYTSLLSGGVGVDPEVVAIVESVRRSFADRILASLPFAPTPLTRVAIRGFVGFVEAASVEWINNKKEVSRDEVVQLMVRTLFTSLSRST
jgi:AcrR family transcriptional regulator